MRKLQTQLNGGAPPVFQGSIKDTINNVEIALSNGIITNAPPGPSMGMGDTGSIVFTIDFEKIIPNYDNATFGTRTSDNGNAAQGATDAAGGA